MTTIMHSPLSHLSVLQKPSKALPQPAEAEGISYKYHRYDEFSSSLQSQLGFPTLLPPKSPLMCRLLLSKGKNKTAQLSPHTVTLIKDNEEKSAGFDADEKEDDGERTEDENKIRANSKNKGGDRRLTVQYPKGSTYNVKVDKLLPITQEDHLIIVSPETTDYRRLCIVQTPKDHSFVEIGCDFALTVGNVNATEKKLGIDKSPSSLEIARKNFPALDLEEVDFLTESRESLMNILERYGMNDCNKLIVGIDINGNRELDAVVECLQRVLDFWHPRLVIVKSRALFGVLLEQGK
mmetsp:Transcript_1721/g.2469  ORF Transcript_1721/g.2469 Transcript_1721/m.2469 type:complete len:294 (-) Transcript_1721:70-951(-)